MTKMNFTLLLLSCLLSANLFGQNVPSYVPTNGLVGWWPFNGNANDESGNGNNGIVNGATLTTDRFGNNNSAYNFNGVNNFIEVLDNPSLQFSSSMSVSLWYNFDSLNFDPDNNILQGRLIDKVPNSTGQGYWSTLVKANSTNSPYYCINDSNSNAAISFGNVGGSITCTRKNTWFNLLYTFNNGFFKIYLNSILIDSNDVAGSNIPINNLNLYFGYAHGTSDPRYYFRGQLDDIGIWNRALTQQEVIALYNGNLCYQTITVTDTLLINTNITSYNPVTYENTIKIWPNPAKTHITIDAGDLNVMNGYSLRIVNAFGQQVFQSAINQQQFYLDLSTWTGAGIYYVNIVNPQGATIDIKKIVIQ